MKHLKIFIGFCSLILLVFNLNESHAAKRTALVIGNSSYKSSPLDNPVNDASDIAKALKRLGFDVILKKNATQRGMEDAMRKFGRKLARSQIGLFYYAGHGMQMQGINYLIPVKNNIKEESEVKYKAVNAGFVLAKMEAAGNPLNIVILDAAGITPLNEVFPDHQQSRDLPEWMRRTEQSLLMLQRQALLQKMAKAETELTQVLF